MRVIYSLTTDRQPEIYWVTNYLLARLYFVSNTQETTKRQVYPSDGFHKFLMLENYVAPSYFVEMKTDVAKQIKMASC